MPAGDFTICIHARRLGQPCAQCPGGIATRDIPEPPKPAVPRSRSSRAQSDEYSRAWDTAEPEPEREPAGECPNSDGMLYWTAGKTAQVCDGCGFWRIPDIAGQQAADTVRLTAESRKRAAALARQNSPAAKVRASRELNASRYRAERAMQSWLRLYDPDRYYPGTDAFKYAVELEPDIRASIREIANAPDKEMLSAAFTDARSIVARAQEFRDEMHAELRRIAELEAGPDDEYEDDETVEAEIVEESGNLPAVQSEPEPTPDEIVSMMISVLSENPDARPTVTCPDYESLNAITGRVMLAHYHVPWLKCQPSGMRNLVFWRDKTALMPPGKPKPLNARNALAEITWCAFPHTFLRAAAVIMLTGSHYPGAPVYERMMHGNKEADKVPCCTKHREHGIRYLSNLGYPYYQEGNV